VHIFDLNYLRGILSWEGQVLGRNLKKK